MASHSNYGRRTNYNGENKGGGGGRGRGRGHGRHGGGGGSNNWHWHNGSNQNNDTNDNVDNWNSYGSHGNNRYNKNDCNYWNNNNGNRYYQQNANWKSKNQTQIWGQANNNNNSQKEKESDTMKNDAMSKNESDCKASDNNNINDNNNNKDKNKNNNSSNNNNKEKELSTIFGDLFGCPSNASLAHCISRDFGMGKGIARLFKSKFGRIDEMRRQNKQIGQAAILYDSQNQRYVYNLITKERYFHKPNYHTITASIEYMCNHAKKNGVKHICMPKIGCGLDKLEWNKVQSIIMQTFANTGIEITVYVL